MFEYQIQYISALAYVDALLDEMKEEFGDLPDKVKSQEEIVGNCESILEETTKNLEEIRAFCSSAKIILVEMKDKEDKLAQQQVNVRNNKEFDALTSEVKTLKDEHEKLSLKLRQEGVKEENLKVILAQQEKELAEVRKELDELNKELIELSEDQREELDKLYKKRERIVKFIKPEYFAEYERVRTFHSEAAVRIVKNSCKGYKIPAQIVVEIRNNMNNIYFDEHSGRILIPEEILTSDDDLDQFV